jgi:hypothetical protein
MNSQEFRALQEAYSQVYELDEATAMAKRGKDETEIRNTIAKKTGGGESADRASALEKQSTYDPKTDQQRQNYARAQRGDFRKTTSSSPGLRGYAHQSSDPAVKAKQAARGNQRARVALTPNERTKLNMEYDLYDIILSHLLDEGYADTEQAAEAIMVNMSEDWRESIVEEVLDEGQKKYPTEKVENAGNRKVRTLRDPNISPEKRLKTTKQLNTITTSFMSHLTNRPQPVPPKRRK